MKKNKFPYQQYTRLYLATHKTFDPRVFNTFTKNILSIDDMYSENRHKRYEYRNILKDHIRTQEKYNLMFYEKFMRKIPTL